MCSDPVAGLKLPSQATERFTRRRPCRRRRAGVYSHKRKVSGNNVTKHLIIGIALSILCLILPVYGKESIAGSVKIVQGGATVIRNTETLPAREGMHLLVGDSLQTAGDGRLGVILQDGTRVSMGPNTKLSIDQFLYEPAQEQFGLVLKLARGVMAYISGKIAQFSPGSVRVETPVAVCGLRGTELAVTIE